MQQAPSLLGKFKASPGRYSKGGYCLSLHNKLTLLEPRMRLMPPLTVPQRTGKVRTGRGQTVPQLRTGRAVEIFVLILIAKSSRLSKSYSFALIRFSSFREKKVSLWFAGDKLELLGTSAPCGVPHFSDLCSRHGEFPLRGAICDILRRRFVNAAATIIPRCMIES